jgi:hypothetical protein
MEHMRSSAAPKVKVGFIPFIYPMSSFFLARTAASCCLKYPHASILTGAAPIRAGRAGCIGAHPTADPAQRRRAARRHGNSARGRVGRIQAVPLFVVGPRVCAGQGLPANPSHPAARRLSGHGMAHLRELAQRSDAVSLIQLVSPRVGFVWPRRGAGSDCPAAQEEELLRRRFRAKGLQLVLKEEMSAVNKKIDVRLKVSSSARVGVGGCRDWGRASRVRAFYSILEQEYAILGWRRVPVERA